MRPAFSFQPTKKKGDKPMEHTTLYYREGSSDKVYQAAIETRGGGYVVTRLIWHAKAVLG